MIVKVQLSLYSSEKTQQVLVYNKDHSIYWQGRATREIKKAMGDCLRAYFNARFDKPTGKVVLLNKVNDRLW